MRFIGIWVVLLSVCSAAAVAAVIILMLSGPYGKEQADMTLAQTRTVTAGAQDITLIEKIPEAPEVPETKVTAPLSGETGAADGNSEKTAQVEEVLPDPVFYDHIVWIGDSRTVGMYWALTGRKDVSAINWYDDEGNFWSAAVGMGLDWMKSTGAPQSEDQILGNTAVIILLGVNDVGGSTTAGAYCEYINRKAREWTERGCSVFFVSSNPVKGVITNGISNREIEEFNQAMSEGLDSEITYVDTYHYLGSDIVYKDHVHYEDVTNLKIYNAVRRYISYGMFE